MNTTSSDGSHHLDKSKQHIRMQDGESAKNEAHAYIALHPKSSDGYMALALAHYACREYPQARIALKECMEFAPHDKFRQTMDMMELFIHREQFQKEELWPRCSYCGGACETPLGCGACVYIHYCSNDCQAKHWKGKHKQLCMSRFAQRHPEKTSPDANQHLFTYITTVATLMHQLDECVAHNQFDKLIEKGRELLQLINKDDPLRSKIFGYCALGFARLNQYAEAVIYANKMLRESYARDSIPRKVSTCNSAANIYTLLGDNTSAVAFRYDSIRMMIKHPELDHLCNLDDCILACCYGLMDESFDGIYRYSKFVLSDTHYLACTAKLFLQKAKVLDTSMRFGFCYCALGTVQNKKLKQDRIEPTETRDDVEWNVYVDLTTADKVFAGMEQTTSCVLVRRTNLLILAALYTTQKKYAEAVSMHRQVFEWSRDPKHKSPHLVQDIYDLAGILHINSQYDEARKYYEECRTLCIAAKDKHTLSLVLYGLILIIAQTKTTDRTLLKAAMMYADELNDLVKENPTIIKADCLKDALNYCSFIRRMFSSL